MSGPRQCPYCARQFKSEGGLKQHINKKKECQEAQRREVSSTKSTAGLTNPEGDEAPERYYRTRASALWKNVKPQDQKVPERAEAPTALDPLRSDLQDRATADQEPMDVADQEPMDLDPDHDVPDDTSDDTNHAPSDTDSDDETTSYGVIMEDESFGSESEGDDAESDDVKPNSETLNQFKECCTSFNHDHLDLSGPEITSIKLLDIIKRKKAPLNSFEEILEWHLKEKGHLCEGESLKDTRAYVRRETLMKRLLKRYNLEPMLPKLKQVKLPHSKAVVTIPYRDAADCIASLLTDPRVRDKDYLFFNNDPLAKPPENVAHLNDLNTGEAYLKSHEKWITKPNQVALPVVFYVDGAVTGQFSSLPVTPLKIALGIHNHQAREQEWAWRELAWIPQVRKEAARGKKLFKESQHMESQDVEVLDGEGDHAEAESDGESVSEDEDADPAVKAQDFHTMMRFALESFVKLQQTGLIWDLSAYGKLYEGLEFVPFVLYVKCDTEEGDLNCGKYLVRTSKIKHICRYCFCPMQDADNPMASYKMKTQRHISRLVENQNLERLKSISQHNIQNAWCEVRFHAANERGIHGACPSEMLHAILLGVFKYVRNIFFENMGEESTLAEDMNGLAKQHGKLLTHQSDRDLPHANFAKGIQKGKLMAKQFRGVLLIMAAVIRSTMGRSLLKTKKRFGKEDGVSDWMLLVELLLEWEAYLCLKDMKKQDVKRLAKKHRFIMCIMKVVATRSKGMGLKLMKYHAIVHLVEDMLLFGVPAEFDTGSNESHHKPAKIAARLTQRKEATFNYQVAKRMTEFLVVANAMEEVNNGKQVWQYFQGWEGDTELWECDSEGDVGMEDGIAEDMDNLDVSRDETEDDDLVAEDTEEAVPRLRIRTGGTKINIFEDPDEEGQPAFHVQGRSKYKGTTRLDRHLLQFLFDLQNVIWEHTNTDAFLPVLSEHRRGDNVFRGHPNHRGNGPWKDWAVIDWGPGWGRLPSHIWCFVVVEGFESGTLGPVFGGIRLANGVCAVVEAGACVDEEDDGYPSDLFTPLIVEVGQQDANGAVLSRCFYLANADAIVGPCVVVPDIGGPKNGYFQVKPRREWSNEFIAWLRSPHGDDVVDAQDAAK